MATTVSKPDVEILLGLNDDYIRSVQHSDVRRFDGILADDFVCSNPDGSLVDREAFLRQALALASVVVDLRVTQVVNGVKGVHAVLADDALR